MNVSLPETRKEFGRQKVAIGNNESASQVVGEGLDLESRRENQIAVGGGRRWLLPGTAQRNFALRSVTLSRPAREALDTRGRFKSSFRTWPLCRTRGNELGRHQRQLHRVAAG
jgi:hypothetical protein